MEWLPDTFLGWTSAIAVVAVGVIAIIGIFDRATRNRKKEASEAETRLVNALKDELSLLRDKMTKQEVRIIDMEKHLHALSAENKVLRDVVMGRDENAKEYQAKAAVAMKQVSEMHESMEKLYKAIEAHLNTMARQESKIMQKL
jgi:hypothetical protein